MGIPLLVFRQLPSALVFFLQLAKPLVQLQLRDDGLDSVFHLGTQCTPHLASQISNLLIHFVEATVVFFALIPDLDARAPKSGVTKSCMT